MDRRRYRIGGGDNACYGPQFGPVLGEEIGEVGKGYGGPFLLVRLLEPACFRSEPVEFLALSPRHVGTDLETIRRGPSTVIAFARILPGMLESAKQEMSADNSQTIAVGRAELIPPTNT